MVDGPLQPSPNSSLCIAESLGFLQNSSWSGWHAIQSLQSLSLISLWWLSSPTTPPIFKVGLYLVLTDIHGHVMDCGSGHPVPICSVYCLTFLVVKSLPASCLAYWSGARRMSHKAFVLLDKSLELIFRVFKVSSIFSLLTTINFWLFTTVANRDIIRVFTTSKARGTVRNS